MSEYTTPHVHTTRSMCATMPVYYTIFQCAPRRLSLVYNAMGLYTAPLLYTAVFASTAVPPVCAHHHHAYTTALL
eukprot:6983108-Pyramimonas_sp.AAC.1